MSVFRRMSQVIDTFSTARHYSELFQLSDAELAARGLNRDALTRSFIAGLGAQ